MTSSTFLLRTSREYALYVCQQRGIPFVGDGLKHVQMIALWLLRHQSSKIKTLALSGWMALEGLYIHGDVSANNAIGLLAAPWKNNVCLIEGEGHFGSRVAPDAIGAPRYTEVRRAKAAVALLYHDLDITPLEENYDGSNKQPKHFLPLIPLVLLNGISGIAVGWSTRILPRDLKALVESTKAVLLGQPIKSLVPCYSKYDCKITHLGGNSWEITGRAKVTDHGNAIHITELPPGLDIEKFRKRLIEMENEGAIKDFTDHSTDSIDITIQLKRQRASVEELIPKTIKTDKDAIEFFKLRERVTEFIVVLDWSGERIRTYENPEELVKDFVVWRLGWYTKRFEHYIERDNYELKYWTALDTLFKSTFTQKLGKFADRAAMQDEVAAIVKTKLDDAQIDRIVNVATYRWTKEFAEEVGKKILDLQAAIDRYKVILKSPAKLRDVYLKELDEIKVK